MFCGCRGRWRCAQNINENAFQFQNSCQSGLCCEFGSFPKISRGQFCSIMSHGDSSVTQIPMATTDLFGLWQHEESLSYFLIMSSNLFLEFPDHSG